MGKDRLHSWGILSVKVGIKMLMSRSWKNRAEHLLRPSRLNPTCITDRQSILMNSREAESRIENLNFMSITVAGVCLIKASSREVLGFKSRQLRHD